MSARTIERTSARKAGWVIILLLVAWVAFLFAPFSSREKPAPRHFWPGGNTAQTKLEAAGLANNPDWDGLPDYFAIWADSIAWKGTRTCFAYWNPGSYSYSYFFEATRTSAGVSFRRLAHWPADSGLFVDEDELIGYAEAKRPDSPTHPFVFALTPGPRAVIGPHRMVPPRPAADSLEKEKVKIEISPQPLVAPPVKL